jgi:hypothetical protein
MALSADVPYKRYFTVMERMLLLSPFVPILDPMETLFRAWCRLRPDAPSRDKGRPTMTILEIIKELYTNKPPEVTVTSSGALHVDPSKLLATDAAQKQIDALRGLKVEANPLKHPKQG